MQQNTSKVKVPKHPVNSFHWEGVDYPIYLNDRMRFYVRFRDNYIEDTTAEGMINQVRQIVTGAKVWKKYLIVSIDREVTFSAVWVTTIADKPRISWEKEVDQAWFHSETFYATHTRRLLPDTPRNRKILEAMRTRIGRINAKYDMQFARARGTALGRLDNIKGTISQ